MTAKQFESRRKALNLSRARLGDILDISPKTIEAWEYGINPVPKWASLALAAIEFTNP